MYERNSYKIKGKILFKHLKDTDVTYLEHFSRSFGFAIWTVMMFFISVIHAIIPFLFTETFSTNVIKLADKLEEEKINKLF
jgi:hypothetical protein